MKVIILLVVLMFPGACVLSQNLIGYKSREIQKYMAVNRKDMNSEKVKNNMYNYLKYTDGSETQTILFFLNNDSICSSIRVICDQRVKEEKIKELNSSLSKNGENKWVESKAGKDYLIELNEDQYSCIFTIKLED